MPFLVCPQCRTRNRIPIEKEGIQGKCGRCGQRLPSFSLQNPAELTDKNFPSFLKQYADLLSIVDFYSPTCGPCQMLAPTIASLPQRFKGLLAVGKLNTTSNPQIAHNYQIRGVPTLLFFRKGQVIDESVGALQESALIQRIQKLL